ncbi:hypothetical protein OSTOST_11252, partial [Ostertagia ostertagi]
MSSSMAISVPSTFPFYTGLRDIFTVLSRPQRKRKIVVYTDDDDRNRVNGAYIMGSYMFCVNKVADQNLFLFIKLVIQ